MGEKRSKYLAVVIGVSAGGMAALSKLLPGLPEEFPLSVIVVQHILEGVDDFLVTILGEKCKMEVKGAEDKMEIQPGRIYLAPPGYHLLVEKELSLALSVDAPVNYSRPSIDVLFYSAAEAYREKLIGIVLTGANDDGSSGLRRIKDLGGLTIVQDPGEAEADFMPTAAIEATTVDHVLPLNEISSLLIDLA